MNNELQQNFATNTRWLASIPLDGIFSDLTGGVKLNLTAFTIPEMEMGKASMDYLGYSAVVPTNLINPGDKQITFNYIISSNYHQYILLFKWLNMLSTNKIIEESEINARPAEFSTLRLPITVTMLSEFKKPIFAVKFHNCFINLMGALELMYQSEDEVVTHEFTCTYTHFTFKLFPKVD